MPIGEGYRSQVAPRTGPAAARVSGEDFGAGIADAVGQAAGAIQRQKIEDYRIERRIEANRQSSEFQVDFAGLREEMSGLSREARQNFTPDHAETLAKEYKAREDALLAKIGDEQVRERAKGTLASWGSSFREGEANWQTVRAGEIGAENFQLSRDAGANRVRRLENPDDYAAELLIQYDAIDTLEVSDKVRDALRKETGQVFAVSYLQGRMDEDPLLAKAMLDSGAFDDVLEPAQVDALLGGAAVEIRRLEVAREREKNLAEAKLREDMSLFREETGQGLDRSEQIGELRGRAEALGLANIVAELDGAAADSAFSQAYEGATPTELEQRMATLRAKGSRTDSEQRELAWIEGKLPGIESRYEKDPVGFYAREGGAGAPPALDFNDPSSILARSRWASAASAAAGRPVPVLSKVEVAQLASSYEGGRAGEESVLALLNRLPPAQAMEAAKQIDPNDRTLPIIATLPQSYRNAARRGREALKADRRLIADQLADDLALADMYAETKTLFDRAMVGVPPDQRAAVYTTAMQIVAGHMDKTGGRFTERSWHLALNMALGASGADEAQKGGFASWGSSWFMLPADVSKGGFSAAVRRELSRSEKPPVNPDGSAANIARAYPVAVGPGLYEFRTAGDRPLRTADGEVWRVKVSAR